jgi:hypothetical protein
MRIELHIDRVVLRGLPQGAAHPDQLRAALEASLTRALGNAEPRQLRSTVEAVRHTSVSLPSEPTSRATGTVLGTAVGKTLTRSGR